MELEFSPRHSPHGAVHHLSPTHGISIDGYRIRRSLSRSPSKPSRFSAYHPRSTATSPTAPASPSGLSRAFNIDSAADPVPKPRFSVKRAGTRPTRRTSPNSPLRRALSDNTNHANPSPRVTRRTSGGDGQENMEAVEESPPNPHDPLFDEPIKIDFCKPEKHLLSAKKSNAVSPMKSSPLKRSDGVMNLEAAGLGGSRNKRRSLHGASLWNDFSVFDQGFDGSQGDSVDSGEDKERNYTSAHCPTASPANSPQKRPLNLRKSTLQQRAGPARSRLFPEATADMSPSLTRARSRISLDSALPMRSFDLESPARRGSGGDPPVFFAQPAQRQYQSAPKPHPLSHALSPSSSSSSLTPVDHTQPIEPEQHTCPTPIPPPTLTFSKPEIPKPPPGFSKSLPIGAMRPPQLREAETGEEPDESFATPDGYQMAKPLPQAFMSTGLISKRNRNMDMPATSFFGSSTNMPDTPSKKQHVHITSTPAPPSSTLGEVARPTHEFGSPSTPFNGRMPKNLAESFGQGANIFGSRVGLPQHTRRGSFVSEGDDFNNSPTNHLDGQSGNDDLPPTPTKSTSTTTRPQSKGKSNSLRSSIFGRRTSMSEATFASPAADESSCEETNNTAMTPQVQNQFHEGQSPQTPQESFTPPDPSSLSISADQRMAALFGSSVHGQPPATPTGPKDSFHTTQGQGHGHASSSYFANDVDTALTARFAHVTTLGIGEFSQVYRVEKALGDGPALATRQSSAGDVWAVKKSRKPYTGNKDRQRKMREVQVLRELRGHEHLVELVDCWEAKNFLYIQTEFYENGNLKDFLLQTGFKGRLDDFRIWKILLELAQGVKSIHDANFIHLDLKPANIFIDWEGVLKVGDFGMASSWPAPPGLDGEGDREYIGPEVLSGRFDKPADIFSLGMIMLEIAGNIVLPDNGTSWQRLRKGDMSDLPSLTWSSESSLVRDESGDPVDMLTAAEASNDSLCDSHAEADDLDFLRPAPPKIDRRSHDLVNPPNFMVDPSDPEALDRVVQWMIDPRPHERPDIAQLLAAGGVQWTEHRRRAGATVFEGAWGPADDVLNHDADQHMPEHHHDAGGEGQDVEMTDI